MNLKHIYQHSEDGSQNKKIWRKTCFFIQFILCLSSVYYPTISFSAGVDRGKKTRGEGEEIKQHLSDQILQTVVSLQLTQTIHNYLLNQYLIKYLAKYKYIMKLVEVKRLCSNIQRENEEQFSNLRKKWS